MKPEPMRNRRRGDHSHSGRGLGVDFMGGPTVDPTENVKDLSEALSQRQDDLREINNLYLLQRIQAVEKVAKVRAQHAREVNALESNRLDKIRQVDILNASRSEERAGEAIKTLATQTATNAETLRTMVANSASTLATQLTNLFAESNKRISALELSSSEGRGKQAVADPQIERLSVMVEQLASRQAANTGKSEGLSDGWKMLIAAVALFATLSGLGVFDRKAPAPVQAPVYFAAPQGTMVPSPNTNPAAVPR
jgi:hypothetical protein